MTYKVLSGTLSLYSLTYPTFHKFTPQNPQCKFLVHISAVLVSETTGHADIAYRITKVSQTPDVLGHLCVTPLPQSVPLCPPVH